MKQLKSSSNSFALLFPHKVGCPKGSVSIKTYANVDIQKLEILKENKGKSGIYL